MDRPCTRTAASAAGPAPSTSTSRTTSSRWRPTVPEAGPSCRLEGGGGEDDVARILALKTVAVVGCSPKPERPGHYVPAFLQARGYKIVPVNPGHDEILGQTCYPSLSAIPFPVDTVEVFRHPDFVLPVIEEAVKIKAKALWLQDGITHPAGEAMARQAGLIVVSDDCMLRRLK